VGLASLLLAAGCGLRTDQQGYFVIAHRDGYPIDLDRQRVPVNDFEQRYGKDIRAGIDEFVKAAPTGQARLLIYVHGGVTTYGGALDALHCVRCAQGAVCSVAEREACSLDSVANPRLAEHHPLFLIWDSSFASSMVGVGNQHPLLGVVTFPFDLARQLASTALSIPHSAPGPFVNVMDGYTGDPAGKWLGCLSGEHGGPTERGRLAATTAALFTPTRLLTVPAIQVFGTTAWHAMKRRAGLLSAPRKSLGKGHPEEKGTARLLLEALTDCGAGGGCITGVNTWRGSDGVPLPLRITIVGHSMGTMVVNHVLETFADVHFDRIIYLGTAASIDAVRGSVLPYLRRHLAATFWAFSLSETREALENNFDLLDRGSLLVWIDNYLGAVGKPGDRTFGRAANLRHHFSVDEFPRHETGSRPRGSLVKFGSGAQDPETHGQLNDPLILERVLEYVETYSGPGRECPRESQTDTR
jgi:hypothetical protein